MILIENVAVAALESLDGRIDVFPPPAAVAASQDRLAEKHLFRSLGIPTAEFVTIDSEADAASADALGWPLILKTRRMGYDGRGQRVAASAPALAAAWRELGGVPSIAEAFVKFDRELSLIAVQGARDERVFYPLSDDDRMVDCILALHRYPDLSPMHDDTKWQLAAWHTQ